MTQDEVNLMWKWVLALRSGQYKQGTEVLRSKNNSFCCLGVLCDISGMGEWIREPTTIDKSFGYIIDEKTPFRIYPPNEIIRIYQKFRVQNSILISMNDNRRLPFEAIADYIFENLKMSVPAEMLEEAKEKVTL